jgi:hypothetical protein
VGTKGPKGDMVLWRCSKRRRRGQPLTNDDQFNGKVVSGPIHRNGENLKFAVHSGAPTVRCYQLGEGGWHTPILALGQSGEVAVTVARRGRGNGGGKA